MILPRRSLIGASLALAVPARAQLNCRSGGLCNSGPSSYTPTGVRTTPNNMTAGSAPPPFVATASTSHTDPAFAPWHAFDGDVGTFWAAGDGNLPPSWIQIDLGTPKYCASFKLNNRSGTTFGSWVNFNLQGSNSDGSGLVTVNTQAGLTWADAEQKTFTVSSPKSFRYWRFNITATPNGSTDYAGIAEIALFA